MIDYSKLKGVFPSGLPEAHTVFATTAADLTYQKLRDEVGYAATNRLLWKDFVAECIRNGLTDATAGADNSPARVIVTGGANALYVGETLQLTAQVLPDEAPDKSGVWSTDNPTIASISATGLVTAKAKGSAFFTFTTNVGGKSSSFGITVTVKPVAVTAVTVNSPSASVKIGSTLQMTAAFTPSNATQISGNWMLSTSGIGTIDENGKFTATAAGSVGVRFLTDWGKQGEKTITVTA